MHLQPLSYDCFLVYQENDNYFILFLLKTLKKRNIPGLPAFALVEMKVSLMALWIRVGLYMAAYTH